MVRLPLGLSAVRRFHLTVQAIYLFIPFSFKEKSKQKKNSNHRSKWKQEENKWPYNNDLKVYRAQQHTVNTDITSIIRQNNIGYKKGQQNKQYYTDNKYD